MRSRNHAFTLVELLVAISILVLLVVFASQLLDQAARLTTLGHKRMDVDGDARQLLDRMTVDLVQMVKRSDVDYYVKSAANPQAGNDQIAFYSMVPGYYPASGAQSPVSVVAYRVNARHQLERMGKGLVWNAVSASSTPIVFLPLTIAATWPSAASGAADVDYELVGTQVFRFEYSYLLTDGTVSNTPWQPSHSSIDGMRDVAAIQVSLAMIDLKSRILVSDSQMGTLVNNMVDFAPTMEPGELFTQWQAALDATAGFPRPAAQGIRYHERQLRLLK